MAAPPESRRHQEDGRVNTGLPSSFFASSSRSPRLDEAATVHFGHRASASDGFVPALDPKSTAYDSDPMRRAGSLDVASSSRRGNEIELLLGEEGRGKSAGQRTATPSRSNNALGFEYAPGWTNPWSASALAEAQPSAPQSRLNGDDTTHRGVATGASETTRVRESSLEGSLSSAFRPLHTPPQVLPRSSSFNYSPSHTPSPRRFADPSSSSSPARRPTSTHSTSSSISDASSIYSEEDNSWAAIGLPSGSSPTRSPIFAETLRQMSRSAQSRRSSEFDFAAAYAATGDDPASPAMPTVGMIQPASPIVPDDSTSQGPSENGGSTTGETEAQAEPLHIPFKPLYEEGPLPKPPFAVPPPPTPLLALETPLPPSPGPTSPSPAPSDLSVRLHPAEKPPSRASSPSTPLRPPSRSSNRSPAGPPRPPRRNHSNLNLAQSHADSASSAVALSPGHTPAPAFTHASSSASSTSASADPAPSSSTSTSSSCAALSPVRSRTSLVFNGSPRSSPPSIPEKSRRRASTLGKRLSSPAGQRENVELVMMDGQGAGSPEMDAMEKHSPGEGSKSGSAPFSVSDFADAYGHTDFDALSESDYPDLNSHIRHAASFDRPSLPAPSSEPMQARTLSVESSSKEDIFLDAPTSRAASALGRTSMDANVERPSSQTSTDAGRSETPKGEVPKGDAKARAAAFIADLKRARAAAARGEGAASAERAAGGADEVLHSPRSPASPSVIISPVEEEAPTLPDVFGLHRPPATAPFAAASPPKAPSSPPLPRPPKRASQSSMKTQPRSPYSPRSRSTTASSLPLLPAPLLRRRPLPPAIQASAELKSARTAVTSPTSSPVKQNRAFRQDSSTATFAIRGDGYRAKEISSHSFTPKDAVAPLAPYPGVLGLGKPPSSSAAASAAPGRSSFFSLGRGSLGRRASKREPPSSSSPPGSVRSTTSISAPSPLIYSSSASTTTAPSNLRPLGGPRMPNLSTHLPGSRASFDSRVSSPSSSPVMAGQVQLQPAASASASRSRASFSYGSTAGAYSSANSPAIAAADVVEDPQEKDKLERLADILPQATRAGLVQALRAADGDEVLAISVYLSEEVPQRR
ncbi:hypothetical protein JCM1841_003108 [Sporobolomyces salmonicolor]